VLSYLSTSRAPRNDARQHVCSARCALDHAGPLAAKPPCHPHNAPFIQHPITFWVDPFEALLPFCQQSFVLRSKSSSA
jgi:hypothetical protein